MRTIEKVHVFRCVGKVNGKVLYRINVVAGGHRHAERTCQLWLKTKDANQVQWQCKIVKMQRDLIMEWEDGA